MEMTDDQITGLNEAKTGRNAIVVVSPRPVVFPALLFALSFPILISRNCQ